MNLNYHKWLDFEVTNSYFSSGESSGFHLVPFQKTTRQMKNYEIMMKKGSNRISFYAGIGVAETFVIDTEFKGLNDLYFQLINEDHLFFNYTDVPFVNDNELYYYENGINSSEPNLFHKSDYVNKEDLIGYKPKKFNIQLSGNEVKIEVKTGAGKIINSTIISGSDVKNYLVNLTHYDDGVYQLWMNDELQETFFISNEEIVKGCMGIIKIDVNKIIIQYQNELKYSIKFNARFVYWQYQVVVPKSRKIEVFEMNVLGIDNEEYIGPIEKEIIGGQTAQVFTTSKAMQLQNKLETNPQLTVTYSNEFSNRKNELELKLPNPEAEQIKKYNQGENEGSFFLPTIVYV